MTPKVVTVFIFFLWCAIFLNAVATAEESGVDEPQKPRTTTSCTTSIVGGGTKLTCSGYTGIPPPVENSWKPEDVFTLDMNGGNTIQTLKSSEIIATGLVNIQSISLRNAQISTVEAGAFHGLHRLHSVDLSYNNIRSLNLDMFGDNENLKVVSLKGNPIHQIVGESPPLPSLSNLDLSHGQLTIVPSKTFKPYSRLQELKLDSNRLNRLDWNVFETSSSLTRLYLQNNPWKCDCHMGFLQDFLQKRLRLNIRQSVNCTNFNPQEAPLLATISADELTCKPVIIGLSPASLETEDTGSLVSNDLVIYSETEKSVVVECLVEAFPEPQTTWLLNGKDVQNSHDDVSISPRIKIESFTSQVNGNVIEYSYVFKSLLFIHNAEASDVGVYSCVVQNPVGRTVRSLELNLTNLVVPINDGVIPPTTAGGNNIFLWLGLGVLVILLVLLLVMGFLICRKRERQRQQKLKNEMMHKFVGSEVVVEDGNPSGVAEPLLPATGGKQSLPYTLPDIALANASKNNEGSLPPFSPRPQNDEMRRKFFTMEPFQQTATDGSAPYNYASLPRPQRPPYTVAMRGRDWGSSQSLVYAPRPVLMRQYSGPSAYPYPSLYGYYSLGHPRAGRPPSLASEPSGRPTYVTSTLPRNFGGGPSSPTNSMRSSYSAYSTMSRGGRRDQVNYDSVGPRTSIDGGSNVSINKLGNITPSDILSSINQGLGSSTTGKVNPRTRSGSSSSTTPGSLRGRNTDLFNFETIEEIDGSGDIGAHLPPSSLVDEVLSNLQSQGLTPPNSKTNNAQPRKKKPPPLFTANQLRTFRKPLRTFEYAKFEDRKQDVEIYDAALDGDMETSAPEEDALDAATSNYGPRKVAFMASEPIVLDHREGLQWRLESVAEDEREGTEV